MIKNLDNLWEYFIESQKTVDINFFKLRQLPIEQQVLVLNNGFKRGDERNVLYFMKRVEPVGYENSQRELSKALLEMLLSTATYPGNYELDAYELVVELMRFFPEYLDKIYDYISKYLEEADIDSDYEVYRRVGNLLFDVKSQKLNTFIARCENHSDEFIKELIDDWKD